MRYLKILLVLFCATSCKEIIEVQDISKRTVTALAPTDASAFTTTDIHFSWDAVEDAEKYKLQIASPDFENAMQIVEDTLVANTTFSKTLTSGAYAWRVRAENSDYQTAYTTQGFSITESDPVDISDETVVLLAPADKTVFASTDKINFSWETVLNAKEYTIQIATPNFANATEVVENKVIATTTFSVSSLGVKAYEWRVKAQNSEYETSYTAQSFTVED